MAKKLTEQRKLTKPPTYKKTKVVKKTAHEIRTSDDFKEARLFSARKAHTARTKKRNLPGPEIVDASDAGGYGRKALKQWHGVGRGYGSAGRKKLELQPMYGSTKRPGGYPPKDWERETEGFFGSKHASKIVNHANPGTKAREKRDYSNKRKK
jgi:hypothetical protein